MPATSDPGAPCLRLAESVAVEPLLVFACGNPSRGDDALGPGLLQQLENSELAARNKVAFLTDFQFNIEHALDLQGRFRVLFVDAHLSQTEAVRLSPVEPDPRPGYTSHAVQPSRLVAIYQQLTGQPAPVCELLSIRGYSYQLGDDLSDAARENLRLAVETAQAWLKRSELQLADRRVQQQAG